MKDIKLSFDNNSEKGGFKFMNPPFYTLIIYFNRLAKFFIKRF